MTAVASVLAGFFDDAALFPPASLPLPAAVAAHHTHRRAWYAPLVGAFVCPWPRVTALPRATAALSTVITGAPSGVTTAAPSEMNTAAPSAVTTAAAPEATTTALSDVATEAAVRISLTLPAGPAELRSALANWTRQPDVRLAAVEVMLPDDMSAREALSMMDDLLPPDVIGYLEVPPGERRSSVLDVLAVTRYRAKFRTGGVTPQAHPTEWELAEAVRSAVQGGVPFKCTAGLHHAIRHTDGQLEQHGFLNLLLAVDVARHGADTASVAAVLASRSAEAIGQEVARVAAVGRLEQARVLFSSIGTCSIDDPIADLVALGLVSEDGS